MGHAPVIIGSSHRHGRWRRSARVRAHDSCIDSAQKGAAEACLLQTRATAEVPVGGGLLAGLTSTADALGRELGGTALGEQTVPDAVESCLVRVPSDNGGL